jgi:hypothetical protein
MVILREVVVKVVLLVLHNMISFATDVNLEAHEMRVVIT